MNPKSIRIQGIAILLAMLSAHVWAGDLKFLAGTAVSYFNDEDVSLMNKAARQVIDAGAVGAKRTWSNSKTGNSGRVTVLRNFSAADGTPCKRLRVENKARKTQDTNDYTVCSREPPGWQLDSTPPASH